MKHSYLILSMVVILFLTILLCIVICRKQYSKNLRLRLDPLEEKELQEDFDSRFLAMGSSSIRRWPLNEIKLFRSSLYNAGIEGQTSAQILLRFERLINRHKPEYLIIQAGANDIKAMGFLSDHKSIEKNYLENVKSVLDQCKVNGIFPIYVTNFPTGRRGLGRLPVWNKGLDKEIVDTNNEMKRFCLERGIFVFDAYNYLVDGSSLKKKKEFSGDFMHLNIEGYKYLNQELEQELQKIIK